MRSTGRRFTMEDKKQLKENELDQVSGGLRGNSETEGLVNSLAGGSVDKLAGGLVNNLAGGSVDTLAGGLVDNLAGGLVNNLVGGSAETLAGGLVDKLENAVDKLAAPAVDARPKDKLL